jgi:hypothetical protein
VDLSYDRLLMMMIRNGTEYEVETNENAVVSKDSPRIIHFGGVTLKQCMI